MLKEELSELMTIRQIVVKRNNNIRPTYNEEFQCDVETEIKAQVDCYTGDEVERYRTLNALCESWPVQYGGGEDNLTNDYGLPWLKKMLEKIAENVRPEYTPPSYSESPTNSCKGHSNAAKKTVTGKETVKHDGSEKREKEGLGNDLSGLRTGDIKAPVCPYFLLLEGDKENNKRNNHNPEEKPLLGDMKRANGRRK